MNSFKAQQSKQQPQPVQKKKEKFEGHTALDEQSVTAAMTAKPAAYNRSVQFSISGVFVP